MNQSILVRTILYAIVLLNFILKSFGKSPIDVDESTLAGIVECLISVGILLLGFWKNNSFTKNAKMADKYLEKLKSLKQKEV